MNWEQKLAAMNALAPCALVMRQPGDWYVSQSAELKVGSILEGKYGNGRTPEEAVNDHWSVLVTASSFTRPIVLNAYGANRRQVYWNGFMWADVPTTTDKSSGEGE